ncbi:hypothetical protein KMT30_37480 [Streptomyces sp. IBSBF 2953]|nr:hypothetical protein [Streptomyces hayashii]
MGQGCPCPARFVVREADLGQRPCEAQCPLRVREGEPPGPAGRLVQCGGREGVAAQAGPGDEALDQRGRGACSPAPAGPSLTARRGAAGHRPAAPSSGSGATGWSPGA